MHRFDAAHAVGDTYEVPTVVAADGIDEFLMWFAGTERREGEMKPGGTVHLHCTDTTEADIAGGEWFVSSLKEPICTFTREHRKGDAAVRGRAHDILMWLWRRSDDGIEIIGDEVVARRFRAYTDLTDGLRSGSDGTGVDHLERRPGNRLELVRGRRRPTAGRERPGRTSSIRCRQRSARSAASPRRSRGPARSTRRGRCRRASADEAPSAAGSDRWNSRRNGWPAGRSRAGSDGR